MSGAKVDVLAVTSEQFDRIESLWEICSFRNGRKAIGSWSESFQEGVASVLGFIPPDNFTLVIGPQP